MIFLINREKTKNHALADALTAEMRSCQLFNWDDINPKECGIYIITAFPAEPLSRDRLRQLAQFRQTVILLGDEFMGNTADLDNVLYDAKRNPYSYSSDAFLKLPTDTPLRILLAFIDWLTSNAGNSQLLTELNLASDLQRSLIPKQFPRDLPINIIHKYLPHTYIGGDLFDVIRLGKNRLGVIITDVSGHGISAAFITAMFKIAFTHYAKMYYSPARVLSDLNKEFFATLHTGHYLTAFYAVFDLKTMSCTYCNGGHPHQLLLKSNGDVLELDSAGFFIGSFANSIYKEKVISFSPGDRFFFYTDGITEVRNARGEQFGRDNLKKVIMENKHQDLASLSNMIISILMMYMNEPSFPDDLTLVILEMMESI